MQIEAKLSVQSTLTARDDDFACDSPNVVTSRSNPNVVRFQAFAVFVFRVLGIGAWGLWALVLNVSLVALRVVRRLADRLITAMQDYAIDSEIPTLPVEKGEPQPEPQVVPQPKQLPAPAPSNVIDLMRQKQKEESWLTR